MKPDGVQRGLVADILGRFERKGYLIKGLKLFQCTKARPAWSLHSPSLSSPAASAADRVFWVTHRTHSADL